MSNVYDYLNWRGDISFKNAPVNEIDSIIFSIVSMLDYKDIVSEDFLKTVTLSEAVKLLKNRYKSKRHLGAIIPDDFINITLKLADYERYSSVKLCGFTNEIDTHEDKQFSAITFILPNKEAFIAFRGTDDTLLGWKEDLELSFLAPVSSQKRSTEYVNKAITSLRCKFYTGGHSKGGNLALWSVIHAKKYVKNKLVKAFCNDGPGFLPNALNNEDYTSVKDKLVAFIPQSSIVGATLSPIDNYKIIHSNTSGIKQHDPLSWEIIGTHYVYEKTRSNFGKQSDEAINQWLLSMTLDERKWLTEKLCTIIESTNAKTLTELEENKLKSIKTALQAIKDIPADDKKMITELLKRSFLKPNTK